MSGYKIFNSAFRKGKLTKVYQEHIKESTAVGLDKIGRDQFRNEYLKHIDIINRKVNNDTYNFTPYKKKLISKGEGKEPRVISIPTFRDRITLRSLCNILSEIYNSDLNRTIPQLKIELINSNIKKKKYDSYIKIDISKFYPSIKHKFLFDTLKRKVRKKQLLNLIKKSITNITVNKSKKEKTEDNLTGIPQGLSISNILAEIYITNVDKEYLVNKNIFYIRYVDDILIFCKKEQIDHIFSKIKTKFSLMNLEIHPLNKKDSKCQSGCIRDEIHFLGYKYKNQQSTVLPNNRQRFEDSIASLLTTFKYRYNKATGKQSKINAVNVLKWRLNLRITGCIFNNNKRGWMFYYSQIEDLTVLYSMDKFIKNLVDRISPTKISIKKLSKTYHETQRLKTSLHKYITNFDTLTANEKKDILENYLGFNSLLGVDDETINRYFNMRITHIIQELEQDIGNLS